MSPPAPVWPRCRAVADRGLLVEFGDTTSRARHDQVRRLDAALAAEPFVGFTEAVPATVSLLVGFDPLATDHAAVLQAVTRLLRHSNTDLPAGRRHRVEVCYDADLAPDLAAVAAATGLSAEAVIAQHLGGDYRVMMFGFAPGYAYLDGVPAPLQRPRKPSPVRAVAAGSVLIAGPQCLVSTLRMPTGWWVIGRSPTRILLPDADPPVRFAVGDHIRFHRLARDRFERLVQGV
jgi:inhibitor of KinA